MTYVNSPLYQHSRLAVECTGKFTEGKICLVVSSAPTGRLQHPAPTPVPAWFTFREWHSHNCLHPSFCDTELHQRW